jgi:hypothetical protein
MQKRADQREREREREREHSERDIETKRDMTRKKQKQDAMEKRGKMVNSDTTARIQASEAI